MKVLYKAGPKMGWKGALEYDTVTKSYVHYKAWPDRTTQVTPGVTVNDPEHYVQDGYWAHYYEPYMQLQEGL